MIPKPQLTLHHHPFVTKKMLRTALSPSRPYAAIASMLPSHTPLTTTRVSLPSLAFPLPPPPSLTPTNPEQPGYTHRLPQGVQLFLVHILVPPVTVMTYMNHNASTTSTRQHLHLFRSLPGRTRLIQPRHPTLCSTPSPLSISVFTYTD